MVRIRGVILPNNKRIEVGLTSIYGIGLSRAKEILDNVKVDPGIRVKDLSEDEISKIRDFMSNFVLEGDLKRDKLANLKRLKEINSYRGNRHSKNLPVRGQRTKTNSRTVRGNRRSKGGSGKVKITKK
ncbi:30S ribosomal protein S13 [Patescibacteria group bacterium]|nr:30S ribosomal protein S13 [Patescibacteria group bacterium]